MRQQLLSTAGVSFKYGDRSMQSAIDRRPAASVRVARRRCTSTVRNVRIMHSTLCFFFSNRIYAPLECRTQYCARHSSDTLALSLSAHECTPLSVARNKEREREEGKKKRKANYITLERQTPLETVCMLPLPHLHMSLARSESVPKISLAVPQNSSSQGQP